jgi:ribosomal protein L9
MASTEILLVEHIENLGSEGDVVKVRPGFARNYLLPQKKAVPLNHANKKRLDAIIIKLFVIKKERRHRPSHFFQERLTVSGLIAFQVEGKKFESFGKNRNLNPVSSQQIQSCPKPHVKHSSFPPPWTPTDQVLSGPQ